MTKIRTTNLKQKQFWVRQVDKKPQGDIKKFPIVAVVPKTDESQDITAFCDVHCSTCALSSIST